MLESDGCETVPCEATMSQNRMSAAMFDPKPQVSWVDVPMVHAQRAIADYLDRETARIDD